jgi:tetratricopeptide (TPR) repeat protein
VAKRSLEAAIELDPGFAAAHAGLARYYFRRAWGSLVDTEESSRLGMAAAERAIALDAESSDARMARANFGFWRHRFQGDYGAHVAAESEMQRAIALDPANSVAYEEFGRSLMWHEPERATSLLERATQVDLLCTGPNIMIASLLGNRGRLEAARARCSDLVARFPEVKVCDMAIGTLESYFGNLDRAVLLLEQSAKYVGGAARIQLWAIHMSAGDRAGASRWLDFGKLPMEKSLSDAARHAMDGRYEEAFRVLDRHRADYPQSRLLDLPAAKFALLGGRPREALAILEARLPDLASGIEPISARNVLPAIDLANARLATGAGNAALDLLGRIALYLDAPDSLRLPLFAVQRARVHALAGESDAAFRALERAFEQGLRVTWALDLRPQTFLFVDPLEADTAFASLRDDVRYRAWFERVRTDSAAQLGSLAPS